MITKPFIKRPRLIASQITLLIVSMLTFAADPFSSALAAPAEATQTTTSKFSSTSFETVWQRVDQPIFASKTNRSWFWGPEPLTSGLYEPYVGSGPYGRRQVQYFDKARMEINNPNTNQVTNGLLVVEMITGRIQEGDNTFDEQPKSGANIAVAGDLSNTSPTYQQLASVYGRSAGLGLGDPVTALWEGNTPSSQTYTGYSYSSATQVAVLQEGFGIPQAFWDFMNRKGTVYNRGQYVTDLVSDWKFSVGLPVTEAYWAQVKVGGVDKKVMFQAFERRVLTYTPDNDPAFQVEMGNVGLHYLQWRYKGEAPQYDSPLLSILHDDNPTQPQWYKTTEVLNVRTAPNSKAPQAVYTKEKPYITQLQRGDHIQVIRTVKGEEVEPGYDRWLQIYESPDMFVYGKYAAPMDVPAFPAPSFDRTHKGLWVAVSINKQMMAIYNDQQAIYTTMVATGRSGYETVTGSYQALGGYRPLSQTMAGGNRAAGDGYSIDDIRNVTYFYRDFAIHGSYWHAKYGIAPQSHGCVNATVYDASLVHQLPVGTPVEVFQ